MGKPAKKFGPDTCDPIIELIFDGLSLSDAAREVGVNVKTVKNWLSKGRIESDGPYRDFATSVEDARERSTGREQPMNEDELRLVVSRAAKKGSVAAQKLYWEMLRAPDDDSGEDEDAFDQLDSEDELERARKRKKAA